MQCNRFVYNVYTWNFQVENVYITMEDPERSELVPWQALTSCVGHNRPPTNEKAAQNRISITIFSPLSQSINALARDYPWRVLKKRRPPNQAYSRPLAQPANMPEVSEQVKQAVNMRAPPRSRSIEKPGRPRKLLPCTFSALEAVEARPLSL